MSANQPTTPETQSGLPSSLIETRTITFAKAKPVSDKGSFVSVEARQAYEDGAAAFSASEVAPIRPEVVGEIKTQIKQTWMARGDTPNPLIGLLFAARHRGWEASEVNKALQELSQEGYAFSVARAPAQAP